LWVVDGRVRAMTGPEASTCPGHLLARLKGHYGGVPPVFIELPGYRVATIAQIGLIGHGVSAPEADMIRHLEPEEAPADVSLVVDFIRQAALLAVSLTGIDRREVAVVLRKLVEARDAAARSVLDS